MYNIFQPNYQNYQPNYQPSYRPSTNGINWVQGIEGAKAYQMMPNSNAMLLDSENDGIFYIKTSDNVGMCQLRIFKYEEVTEQKHSPVDMSQYVTRDELEKMLNDMLGGKTE